jgi:hypothetical protein
MQLSLRRGFGYAYDPFRGMRGLGDDTTTLAIDPSGGYVGAPIGVVTSTDPVPGSTYDQLIAQGVTPADAYQYDPAGAIAAGVDPSTLFPITSGVVTPGAALTPAQLAAQQGQAQAWLLQNVPPTPSGLTQAQQLASLALTAAQIASGVSAGTVQSTSTSACPSGYKYAAGPCVPSPGLLGAPLIAGVSNTTLAIGAVIFLALMMMGGKRR